MIIGIDGHTLNEKEKFGVSTYAYEITSRIIKHAEDRFILYSQEKLTDPIFKQKNVDNVVINCKLGWTQFGLSYGFLKDKIRPDIMFFPAHSISRYAPMKKVVAIHDLAFLKFSAFFTKKDLLRLKSLSLDAAKRADKILTCSQSTKNDIAEFYGKEMARKTVAIPLGYDKQRFNPSCSDHKLLREAYKIEKPYLFYAGSFQPRKDLPTLIKAFEQVSLTQPELLLVLAGGGGWLKEAAYDAINRSTAREKIIQLGYVPAANLPALYAGARIFVLPSLYEGFGIPLLEAMACGRPVVYANNSSLPEVAGTAGLSYRTGDCEDLKVKLTSLLSDKDLWQNQSEKSVNQAKKFSWDKAAEETYQILREVGLNGKI